MYLQLGGLICQSPIQETLEEPLATAIIHGQPSMFVVKGKIVVSRALETRVVPEWTEVLPTVSQEDIQTGDQ